VKEMAVVIGYEFPITLPFPSAV